MKFPFVPERCRKLFPETLLFLLSDLRLKARYPLARNLNEELLPPLLIKDETMIDD